MTLVPIILSIIAILLIPGIAVLIRGAIKWTRVEVKLDTVVDKMEELVHDKDKIHNELYSQMKSDREATNARLTYLEHLWIENKK